MDINKFIFQCKSWDDLYIKISSESKQDKGDIFDRLTQLYLLCNPIYKQTLQNVWLLKDVPYKVKKILGLPDLDKGIDQIARTFDGEYWAIQSKYRSDHEDALTYTKLSTFSTLTFVYCKNISLGLVSHASTKPIRNRKLLGNVVEVGLNHWLEISDELWNIIREKCYNKNIKLKPRSPLPHQKVTLKNIKQYFNDQAFGKGRVIMPCGTGKSLIAFWAARDLKASSVVLAVPSLYLINQALKDWMREISALQDSYDILIVCSDRTTKKIEHDEFVDDSSELGIEVTTDEKDITKFLVKKSSKKKIIFSTYQSGQRLINASHKAKFTFDLTILDEAHKTTGNIGKPFAALVAYKNYKTKKRIFLTATERVYRGDADNVLTMSNKKHYGDLIYQMSFKEAINSKPSIITDYKIVTIGVSESRIKKLIEGNQYLFSKDGQFSDVSAHDIGVSLALSDLIQNYSAKHAISFHSSIKRASNFMELNEKVFELIKLSGMDHFHISSKLNSGKRTLLVKNFADSSKGLITNARCLTEGIDVPKVDTVIFSDPKNSIIDIVQAAGRALRQFKGKKFGYILVPIIVPEKQDFEDYSNTTEFKQVVRVVSALSTQDERIKEDFSFYSKNKRFKKKSLIETKDFEVTSFKLQEFNENIYSKVWSSVARINFKPYLEAQKYILRLKIPNQKEWWQSVKNGSIPEDIPHSPQSSYKNKGWTSWGEFLGTGNLSNLRKFKPYKEAKKFARSLELSSATEWRQFCKEKKPKNIPFKPERTYMDEGWIDWYDFLGTKKNKYKLFKEARKFARSLNLNSTTEWRNYCKSEKKPEDIPTSVENVYKDKGWVDWNDFLGKV